MISSVAFVVSLFVPHLSILWCFCGGGGDGGGGGCASCLWHFLVIFTYIFDRRIHIKVKPYFLCKNENMSATVLHDYSKF